MELLESYYKRFWKRLWKDAAPWARDNIVWTSAGAILPPLVLYFRNRHTQIDWALIQATLELYGGVFALYFLVHLNRIPKKLDLDRNVREVEFQKAISDKDAVIDEHVRTIRRFSERPPRTPAEKHDYETASAALKLLGEKGKTALRFLRRRGRVTYDFPVQSSTIPPGMNTTDTMWVYNHCASEAVIICEEKPGSGVRTFSIPPNMAPIWDELLYENGSA